jgi:hypothetical protein
MLGGYFKILTVLGEITNLSDQAKLYDFFRVRQKVKCKPYKPLNIMQLN